MNIKHLKIETKDVGKLRFWILPLIVIHILLMMGCVSNQSPPPTTPPVRTEPEPPKLYDPGRGRATEIFLSYFLPYKVKETIGKGTRVNTKWYKINLEEAAILNIELQIEKENQKLDVELLDQYTWVYANNISNEKKSISRELKKGIYYFRVFVADDTYGSTYLLTLNIIPILGSSMDNPIELIPGKTLTDFYSVLERVKTRWYKFKIEQLCALKLTVNHYKQSQDFKVILRNSQGKKLVNGRGKGASTHINRKIKPGNYFLEIRPAENTSRSNYSISLKTYPIPIKELTGPGSDKENAIEIPSNENIISGKMGQKYGSQERWYWFDITKRVSMKIRFGAENTLTKLYIELLDDAGGLLNSESIEEDKKISRIVDKGRYFLRCFSKRNRGDTRYWLEILFTDDPGAGFLKRRK